MYMRLIALIGLLFVSASASADSKQDWIDFSDVGSTGLVVAALAVPTYNADWEGLKQSSLSVVTASGAALVGKALVSKTRPDGSDDKSFPSNHTSTSFGAATTLAIRYGWQAAIPAYTVATLVGVGRIEADRHHWEDVVAGAALGSLAGWIFTTPNDKQYTIVPWVDTKQAGVLVSMNW
ncbi:phosphatase PAP2 family protein [Vibrio profundum]|uniref:phosphatase PAP2 family protein n=1 Tax=Vibrio profundum TaxID=2910247 RepID=UPI003D129A02